MRMDFNKWLVVGALAAAAVSSAGVRAAPLTDFNESRLKHEYAQCEGPFNRGTLSKDEAAHCSAVHRELVEKVFGGDARALEAWRKGLPPAEKGMLSPGPRPVEPSHPKDRMRLPEKNDKLHMPDSKDPALEPKPIASKDASKDASTMGAHIQ